MINDDGRSADVNSRRIQDKHREPIMEINVPKSDYDDIEKTIASESSPVGIDAKKTHIIIIQKLMAIERRLDKAEANAGGS